MHGQQNVTNLGDYVWWTEKLESSSCSLSSLRLALTKKKTRMYVSVVGQSVSWQWIKSATSRVRNPESDSEVHTQYLSIIRRVVEAVDFLLGRSSEV